MQRPVTLYKLDAILAVGYRVRSNGFPLLTHAGSISHDQMEACTGELYAAFNQGRKAAEARAADAQDEAELKALEATLKQRAKP